MMLPEPTSEFIHVNTSVFMPTLATVDRNGCLQLIVPAVRSEKVGLSPSPPMMAATS